MDRPVPDDVPFESHCRARFDGTNSLGPYVQVGCNIKVWFDASAVSLLVQGAPDLHEYGLEGGAGLLTRTYASGKIAAYAGAGSRPWQEGLSFNYVNMHLQLLPNQTTAVVPAHTPIFSSIPSRRADSTNSPTHVPSPRMFSRRRTRALPTLRSHIAHRLDVQLHTPTKIQLAKRFIDDHRHGVGQIQTATVRQHRKADGARRHSR